MIKTSSPKLAHKMAKHTITALLAGFLCLSPAFADLAKDSFIPTIWVDPDGCEHWVFDDGTEGFMTPNLNPDGTPNCNRTQACMQESSDWLFESGSEKINQAGVIRLRTIFADPQYTQFIVSGHTDSDGSYESNIVLGQKRANAVANMAKTVTKSEIITRSYGESEPIASNATKQGKAKNRRIEIYCVAEQR